MMIVLTHITVPWACARRYVDAIAWGVHMQPAISALQHLMLGMIDDVTNCTWVFFDTGHLRFERLQFDRFLRNDSLLLDNRLWYLNIGPDLLLGRFVRFDHR